MVFNSAVTALKPLKTFVESRREKFHEYEDAGKRLSGTAEYAQVCHHLRNVRLIALDYSKAEVAQMTPREKFCTESFIPVVDQFIGSLTDENSCL